MRALLIAVALTLLLATPASAAAGYALTLLTDDPHVGGSVTFEVTLAEDNGAFVEVSCRQGSSLVVVYGAADVNGTTATVTLTPQPSYVAGDVSCLAFLRSIASRDPLARRAFKASG